MKKFTVWFYRLNLY